MSDTQPDIRIHAKPDDLVPRVLVRIMFAMVAAVLALVAVARMTDRPLEATPAETPIISERTIFISGSSNGAARILDQNGTLLVEFPSDKGGFVAGIERVIARERGKIGAEPNAPVTLRLREGNRLSLYDPSTEWSAELMGFGADNLRTFARLLSPPSQKGSH